MMVVSGVTCGDILGIRILRKRKCDGSEKDVNVGNVTVLTMSRYVDVLCVPFLGLLLCSSIRIPKMSPHVTPRTTIICCSTRHSSQSLFRCLSKQQQTTNSTIHNGILCICLCKSKQTIFKLSVHDLIFGIFRRVK